MHADGHGFYSPHKNVTVTTSAVCHYTQNKHFFMCCFRRWTKQPRATARTSARCIVGTIYQSNHALQTLNTATVFSASLFFAAIFLTSLPLPRSVWTAPLLVQLSPANACKEKWPRLKVMGGTGVPFKWYICPLLEHNAPHFVKTITRKTEELHGKDGQKIYDATGWRHRQ